MCRTDCRRPTVLGAADSSQHHLQNNMDNFEIPEDSSVESRRSFFVELIQSELALWTFVFTSLTTYLWQSRKRFCLFNLGVVVPSCVALTVFFSWILFVYIAVSRVFWKDSGSAVDSWVVKRLSAPHQRSGSIRRRKSFKTKPRNGAVSNSNFTSRPGQKGQMENSLNSQPKDSSRTAGKTFCFFWQRRPSIDKSKFARKDHHFRG